MTSTPPRLSICIPTYNFGKFIGETLSSIVDQLTDDVEVVILDSASTDNTGEVVAGFQKQRPSIRYVRNDYKGGIDRDMATVVDHARGDYCWLFSADDTMRPGALEQVREWLKSGDDVYLGVHSNNSLEMEPLIERHPVLRSKVERRFELSNDAEQLAYFRLALTTEAFFSFLGTIVARRSKWSSVPLNEKFVGSCWAHVARFFELIPRGLSVRFVPVVLVSKRGDNDSFRTHGLVKRLALAIDGYRSLAEHFWPAESEQAYHIRRAIRGDLPVRNLLGTKALCARHPETESIEHLRELADRLHSDSDPNTLMRRVAFAVYPVRLHEPLRHAYRFFIYTLRGVPRPRT